MWTSATVVEAWIERAAWSLREIPSIRTSPTVVEKPLMPVDQKSSQLDSP
jgi:hypothetical protein